MSGYMGDGWEPPVGHYIQLAGAEVPPDYLLCDGSAISRTVYAKLFSKIGTKYGAGDGVSTFNLPPFQNADTFLLPTARRFDPSVLSFVVGSSGATRLNATTANITIDGELHPGVIKARVYRKSGKLCIGFSLAMVSNPFPGLGYAYIGLTANTNETAATLATNCTTGNGHYIKIQYTTTAGGSVTINNVYQYNNGTVTLLSGFAPIWGEQWFILYDLDARTWTVKTNSGATATLQSGWAVGNWYPFIAIDGFATMQAAYFGASGLTVPQQAIVAGYTLWPDITEVLSGDTSGSATHTHVVAGTAISIAQMPTHFHVMPAITPESTAFNAGGGSEHRTNNSASAQVTQTDAQGGGQPHTHGIDAVNNMPQAIHALIAIKYR